ncbi:MAG: class II aldolase/adducin family protein [Candidatus Omnitrophica bacterium]|nr:class II aldolase/adducin family protein [Candidatus Omnitrophota bacterium]
MRKANDVRKELVKRGRQLYAAGLALGRGGNISVLERGRIFIKAAGVDMEEALVKDYPDVGPEEALSESKHGRVSTEIPMHLACYRANRAIKAVVHVHSPELVAVSALTKVLESNSYEFDCLLGRKVPVVPFIEPGSDKLGRAVAKKVSESSNGVLLARHGAVCFGRTLKEACDRAMALSRACRLYLYLEGR